MVSSEMLEEHINFFYVSLYITFLKVENGDTNIIGKLTKFLSKEEGAVMSQI